MNSSQRWNLSRNTGCNRAAQRPFEEKGPTAWQVSVNNINFKLYFSKAAELRSREQDIRASCILQRLVLLFRLVESSLRPWLFAGNIKPRGVWRTFELKRRPSDTAITLLKIIFLPNKQVPTIQLFEHSTKNLKCKVALERHKRPRINRLTSFR